MRIAQPFLNSIQSFNATIIDDSIALVKLLSQVDVDGCEHFLINASLLLRYVVLVKELGWENSHVIDLESMTIPSISTFLQAPLGGSATNLVDLGSDDDFPKVVQSIIPMIMESHKIIVLRTHIARIPKRICVKELPRSLVHKMKIIGGLTHHFFNGIYKRNVLLA